MSFTGRAPNPLVELPATPEEILDGVELVVVSHLHADHFDPVAQSLVPKYLPLICQPGDEDKIRSYGFNDVMPLAKVVDWNGIRLRRREGSHGLGPVVRENGTGDGFQHHGKRRTDDLLDRRHRALSGRENHHCGYKTRDHHHPCLRRGWTAI